MFRVLSNQHYPHCTNQKQNRRVCGQAFPSFSSPPPSFIFFLLLSQHSRRTREETLATQASTTVFCKLELHVLRLRKEKETGTPHLFVASLLGTLHGFFLFLVTVPEVFAKANPAEFPFLFLKWQMHYSIKYKSEWILLGSISNTDSKVRLLGTVNPVTRTEPLMYILKFRISNKSYGVTVKRLWHCFCFIILRIEFAFLNFDTLYFLELFGYFILVIFQVGFKI